MKDTFGNLHPVVTFLYFVTVIVFTFLFLHPVMLFSSLACGILYSLYLGGVKTAKFNFLILLPGALLLAIINPVFNHEGATILVYVNENPITLESILYGAMAAAMFFAIIVWFSCYNIVMTSDKIIYLFGKILPSSSLLISMVLRFVPRFRMQYRVILNAQRSVGKGVADKGLIVKTKNALSALSVLISWAMENAIETADSMKARGYGLPGRTAFSNYRFSRYDATMFSAMMALLVLIITGLSLGAARAVYFPKFQLAEVTWFHGIIYLAYAVFLLLPMGLNITEDLRWHYYRSKI